jgi:probable HAF family extracellular repeat protein
MRPVALLALPLLCLSTSQVHAQAPTQVRELRAFAAGDVDSSIATGVNLAGQVAGIVGDHEGKRHAVLYDGRLVRLPALGGEQSDTAGINRHGMVVGSAETAGGRWRAFLYRRGEPMRDLGSLSEGSSFGTGINDAGQAVGMARTADGYFHAFVTGVDGAMTDLGTLGGKVSNAAAINNGGAVAGTAAMPDGYRHAFLVRPGQGMSDLGTLGGRSSAATAINDAGRVVGAAQLRSGRWHAFLHDGRRMIDLGAAIGYGDSFATGINAAGHVVGTIVLANERRTFVYRDGKIKVHYAGKALYVTNGINDRGVVVGARFDTKRYAAAVMPADMVPVTDHGRGRLLMSAVYCMLLAFAAVILRKCYLGFKPATG